MRNAKRGNLPIETLFDRKHPWRTFSRLYQGERWRLGACLFFYLVKHSPVWLLPVYTGWMVDSLSSGSHSAGKILLPSLGMAFLVLLNIPAHLAFSRLLSVTVRGMEARVRMAEVKSLQQLSLALHGSWPTGNLQNKVLRDVENLATLTSSLANNIFPSLVTILIAVALTLGKSPLLTAFFLVVAPLAMLVRNAFSRKFSLRNANFRKRLEAMNSRVLEMIELLPVTRAHAMEDFEIDRTGERIEEVREEGKRLDFVSAWFGASAWVVFMFAQLTSLILMVFLASRSVLTVGQVLLFQSYFASVMGAMNGIINLMPDLARGAESIRSIGEILESPDLERNVGKPSVASIEGAFEFIGLSYRYPGADNYALSGIAFRLPAGSVAAVTGESGSGKSTLMHLALGFLRPSEGRILLDGRDMADLDLRSFRQQVATVTQQPLLFRGSIRDNIGYGMPGIADAAIWKILESLGAADFVANLPEGLGTEVGNQGSGLSGGQKQRIVMARAMIRSPRVLILDEPTSALDPGSEREVRRAIASMAEGRTVFIVTHRPDTIGEVDLQVRLERGRMIGMDQAGERKKEA